MKTMKYIAFIAIVCLVASCSKEDNFDPVMENVLLTQSVSGSVFVDTNLDTIGDIPLVGARVYLGDFQLINEIRPMRPDTLAAPYNEIVWADVDANGNYEMNALVEMADVSLVLHSYDEVKGIFGTDVTPDGDYLETEIFGIIPVTLETDEIDDGNNFVVHLINYGEISGNIQIDEDKDGVLDGPLEGVKLWLSRRNPTHGGPIGLALDNVRTDANGNYTFEKVKEGEYIVAFADVNDYTVLTGIDASPDSDPTHPIKEFLPVVLTEGEKDTDNNYTVQHKWHNVSGLVLEDTTADGKGDTPISQVRVELFARDMNGQPSGTAVAFSISDGLGAFKFIDQSIGQYVIKLIDVDYDCLSSSDVTPENNEPTSSSCTLIPTNIITQDSEDSDNIFEVRLK